MVPLKMLVALTLLGSQPSEPTTAVPAADGNVSEPRAAPEVSVTGPLAAPVEVREEIMAAQVSYVRNPGTKMRDGLTMSSGSLELGAELAFVTSSAELAGEPLAFTDLALLRLRARKTLSDALELFAAGQLLAKQPRASELEPFQGALAGGQWLFAPDFALRLHAGGGPVLEPGSGYLTVSPAIVTKPRIDHHVHFELGVSYAFSALDVDAPGDPLFHLHELIAHAEAQLGEYSGGFFFRFDYHLPLASGPSARRSPERYLDPSVRFGVLIGGVLVAGDDDDWDVYGACAIIDHGEEDDAASQLPTLDGGFDQQQWIFGVQHRFDGPSTTSRSAR